MKYKNKTNTAHPNNIDGIGVILSIAARDSSNMQVGCNENDKQNTNCEEAIKELQHSVKRQPTQTTWKEMIASPPPHSPRLVIAIQHSFRHRSTTIRRIDDNPKEQRHHSRSTFRMRQVCDDRLWV